ncbi:hypothetical protein N320_05712, partial [Buceros rhinoceros silvestris]
DAGHRSLRGETGFDEGPWVEHAQKPVDYDLGTEFCISHLFALGRRRVKPVIGKIPCEDVQFTGNYPPWIPKIQLVLWRKKGLKLPGK